MSSSATVTRRPGVLYLLLGLPAVVSLEYVPAHFCVPGDAAATAQRITEAAGLYRIGVLADLVSNIFYLVMALTLYELFKDVNRKQARLLVALVSVSVALALAVEVLQLAPLVFLGHDGFLSAFTRPQLEALAMAFVRLRGTGIVIDSALWGLWLLPFGVLVIQSGFLPKILGVCLIVGCLGYLTTSVTGITLPAYRSVVSQAMLPLYAIGELPIALWFLIKGVRVPARSVVPR